MKRITKRAVSILLILALALCMSACGNSPEKIQRIKDTFASFPYSDRFIMVTLYEIRVGDTVIGLDDIDYNGEPLRIIFTEEHGAYGYSVDPESSSVINVVYLDYDSLAVELVAELQLPSSVIASEVWDGKLYFRTLNPDSEEDNQLYFIYDIATGDTQTVDTDDVEYELEYSADHSRSSEYTIMRKLKRFSNVLEITDKATRKRKEIGNKLLENCKEGRSLIKLGRTNLGTGCSEAYEKDGSIYIPFLYCLDPLGNPCYYYIMKYDFESHAMEYYTSVYFEEYPEDIVDIYIP